MTKKDPMIKKLEKKRQYEERIIGAMLLKFEYIPEITDKLTEKNFSGDSQKAFTIIKDLYNQGTLSPHLIKQVFEENGLTPQPYIEAATATDSLTLDHKMKRLMDLNYSISCDKMLKDFSALNDRTTTGLETYMAIREECDNAILQAYRFKEEETPEDAIDSVFDNLKNTDHSNALCSRTIPSMNESAMLPGNFIVIAGYLKSGKTTTAISLLLDYAVNSGIPCGIISIEMTKVEVYSKIISGVCDIPYSWLRENGALRPQDIENYRRMAKEKMNGALIIVDDRSQTLEAICQKIRFWKHRYNIRVAAVDYIQLITTPSRKFESSEREIALVSKTLKALAKELNIVIFGLAQLNREGAVNPSSHTVGGSLNICKDADSYYVVFSPVRVEAAKKEIPVKPDDKVSVTFSENNRSVTIGIEHFILQLAESRHSVSGKKMLLRMDFGSKMTEIDPKQLL